MSFVSVSRTWGARVGLHVLDASGGIMGRGRHVRELGSIGFGGRGATPITPRRGLSLWARPSSISSNADYLCCVRSDQGETPKGASAMACAAGSQADSETAGSRSSVSGEWLFGFVPNDVERGGPCSPRRRALATT